MSIVNSDKNEIQLIQSEKCENDGQKCHICDQYFQNLESHFVSSHIKEENNDDENLINDNLECKDFESVNIKKEIKQELEIKQEKQNDNWHTKTIKTVHEKDHKCASCGKEFGTLQNLKIHIKTVHEKQKDYKCKTCGKEFGLLPNLKKHIKTVHEGQKYWVPLAIP